MRLKPVEQGQARDKGMLDDQGGQGKRHGRPGVEWMDGWMVVGAKEGHRTALVLCSLVGKGQAPVADSNDAAATPSLSEWKVDGASGVAS